MGYIAWYFCAPPCAVFLRLRSLPRRDLRMKEEWGEKETEVETEGMCTWERDVCKIIQQDLMRRS